MRVGLCGTVGTEIKERESTLKALGVHSLTQVWMYFLFVVG